MLQKRQAVLLESCKHYILLFMQMASDWSCLLKSLLCASYSKKILNDMHNIASIYHHNLV